MAALFVGVDRPDATDVKALLQQHLAFARAASPPESVFALDVPALLAEDVSFFSIRSADALLGVGALKRLDDDHAEIKSMHTTHAARGTGVGRAMLDHLVSTARVEGYQRVSLETGSMEEFAPARALYRSAGFRECGPFGGYVANAHSVFMTLELQ